MIHGSGLKKLVLKFSSGFVRNVGDMQNVKNLTAFFMAFFLTESPRRKNTGIVPYSATPALGMCVNLATACERERTCNFS